MDDLAGATINGKTFDIYDYSFDEKRNTGVVMFTEYCYSLYSNKQDNFGLYLYVWNPKGLSFDTSSSLNKVQMSAGDRKSYTKYSLIFLSKCKEENYEGLFYKFKVDLSDKERTTVLNKLDSSSRFYHLSGIELLEKGKTNATETTVNLEYTFSGYAAGYGPVDSTESTLKINAEQGEVLTLDVHSTYWRPSGTNGEEYSRDTLHSVYFSVPNYLIEKYGEMTAVHATWLNALTSPVFVTGNETVYNEVSKYLGQYVDGGNYHLLTEKNYNTELTYSLIASKLLESAEFNHAAHNTSYISYNANRLYTHSDMDIYTLAYCFLADKVDGKRDASNYILPAELLIGDKGRNVRGWFETYTEKHGGELVNDRFSKELFAEVADSFTDITIRNDTTFTLTEEIISQNLWQKFIGGGYNVTGKNEYKVSAIKSVEEKDFKKTKSQTCDELYINESDYDEFKEFYDKVTKKENPETVYLFRYYQSSYTHNEVATYSRGNDGAAFRGFDYDFVDKNAYFMQMWVQLGFDIIDVTFTNGGVDTVIPVVMSPIDLAADGDKPVLHGDDEDWWKILIAILSLILLFVILGPILPTIISFIINIVLLPFKAIAALFKAIFHKRK